jgi:hypothetical protein
VNVPIHRMYVYRVGVGFAIYLVKCSYCSFRSSCKAKVLRFVCVPVDQILEKVSSVCICGLVQ